MSWNKITAIFHKQVLDTFKNKTVLIQFVMFPIMALIMQNFVKIEGMQENFFVMLFASMYIAMAPITSMSAIISEEKEKHTLRVLLMSNVRSMEYLVGVGSYVFGICMMGSLVFAGVAKFEGRSLLEFLIIMEVGILISILIGSAIGIFSNNQMVATSLTVPIMIVFSFLPMISTFNQAVQKISVFAYSEQIHLLMYKVGQIQVEAKCIMILLMNVLIMLFLFAFIYKKRGLA